MSITYSLTLGEPFGWPSPGPRSIESALAFRVVGSPPGMEIQIRRSDGQTDWYFVIDENPNRFHSVPLFESKESALMDAQNWLNKDGFAVVIEDGVLAEVEDRLSSLCADAFAKGWRSVQIGKGHTASITFHGSSPTGKKPRHDFLGATANEALHGIRSILATDT